MAPKKKKSKGLDKSLPEYESKKPMEKDAILEHLALLEASTSHAEKKHTSAKNAVAEAKAEVDTFKDTARDILRCCQEKKPLWKTTDGGVTSQPPESWLPSMAKSKD